MVGFLQRKCCVFSGRPFLVGWKVIFVNLFSRNFPEHPPLDSIKTQPWWSFSPIWVSAQWPKTFENNSLRGARRLRTCWNTIPGTSVSSAGLYSLNLLCHAGFSRPLPSTPSVQQKDLINQNGNKPPLYMAASLKDSEHRETFPFTTY